MLWKFNARNRNYTICNIESYVSKHSNHRKEERGEEEREAQTETKIKFCYSRSLSCGIDFAHVCLCTCCVNVSFACRSCKYSFFLCLFICLLDLPLFTVSFADFVASFFHAKLHIMLVCSRLHNSFPSLLSSLFHFVSFCLAHFIRWYFLYHPE